MIHILLLSVGLLTASTGFAEVIHTQGEGNLLEQVFKAISKILYGDGKNGLEQTFNALLKISLTVGGFCALLLAFSRQKFEPLIRSFLIPGLIIVGFLLVPKTSIEIEGKKGETIEVPFFLGKFAAWTSYSFDQLHTLFKNAIGDPYPWTSNIYAGKTFFQSGSVPLSDPLLEENLREFCRECVFRDLGLGLYTKKELAQAPDLLQFLVDRTSVKRAVVFNGEAIPCQEAASSLKDSITAQSLSAGGHVDLLFENPGNNLAAQKLVIDLLQEEIFRPDLKACKKESFGAQGVILLMSLRSFFEAMLYLIFPLIVLLSLLSFGIRTALLWVRSIVWVSMWPIFYLAVDLFLDAVWKLRGGNAMLNLENAARLSSLYNCLEMIACAALASIPFLSWFLIKGGISQMVHLSSSLPFQEKFRHIEETGQPQNSPARDDPQDTSRQTHWEVLVREAEKTPSEEDGFKATVESAKLEDRIDSLQRSLSSIRESVKESATDISKAINIQNEIIANPPSHPVIHATEDARGSSRMHIPSHGSWSAAEKERDTEPV